MPRPRFLNLAPEERSRLLEIATKHFARHGFEAASLNEILAEAGISKGAYYYYFDDKDDLFATTLETALDELFARLPVPKLGSLGREEFWPTVEAIVESWCTAIDTSSDLVQAAMQLTEAQRRSPRYAPILAKASGLYRAVIEPGRRLGCIRSDLPVDVLVRLLEANDTVLDGLFLATHRRVTRETLDAHARLVFDTFKRLLVAEPAVSPPPAPARKGKRRG